MLLFTACKLEIDDNGDILKQQKKWDLLAQSAVNIITFEESFDLTKWPSTYPEYLYERKYFNHLHGTILAIFHAPFLENISRI